LGRSPQNQIHGKSTGDIPANRQSLAGGKPAEIHQHQEIDITSGSGGSPGVGAEQDDFDRVKTTNDLADKALQAGGGGVWLRAHGFNLGILLGVSTQGRGGAVGYG